MNPLSSYMEQFLSLTGEIASLLDQPEEPLESIEKKMAAREELIYTLQKAVDNEGKRENTATRTVWSELLKADLNMRTKLENRINQTAEALRMQGHEEKAGRSYIGRKERSRFITGRLEG